MQTWKIKKKPKKSAQKKWKPRLVAILAIFATLAMGVYDFPSAWNGLQAKAGFPLPTLPEEPFRLGLDLQGGTHLVYEADMSAIPEENRLEALEGVRDVIERRVNAFGVSEPVVQTTTTGGTYRLVIELAGVLDVTEAISLIGETPVLEFKEPGEEQNRDPTEDELNKLDTLNAQERSDAEAVLARARAGEDFGALVKEFSTESNVDATDGILENITSESDYANYVDLIKKNGMYPGQVYGSLVEETGSLNIFKYLNSGEKTQMLLSHILICYEGKTGCTTNLPAIEANNKIANLAKKATPENFAELASLNSDDPSAASNSGDLGWSGVDDFVPSFGSAAAALEVGEISDPVETEYGYHIIYKRDQRTSPAYTIQRIAMKYSDIFDIAPELKDPWVNTELSGKDLEHAAVEFDSNTGSPYVALTFNAEGGDLFGKLTQEHIGEPIAIFLDGEPISTPVVQQAIYGGRAVITGNFTVEEAKLLAQRLNAGALPVPIRLLSQQTVGPTLGAVSLEKSVSAALFGFLLVALYMIIYYRVPGLISVLALALFAFLNLAAYRLFGVTITLAGIAGFVLSLGIAVDANVLIIERFKEEYSTGRDFISAVDEAFVRAWTAIRDGNLTTLIAAGVLYWFSSSFIRGFALTLSIGVILSMFTAITVTRVYIKSLLLWKRIRKPSLFGVKRS